MGAACLRSPAESGYQRDPEDSRSKAVWARQVGKVLLLP
jgi:hypothetical protein